MSDKQADDEQIAAWLRTAPPRPSPSETARLRARNEARSRWQGLIHARQRTARRLILPWAAAAGIALAVIASTVWMRDPGDPPAAIAFGRIEYLAGPVRVSAGESPERAAISGGELTTGTYLATGDGQLAIAVPDGLSLRVDRHSILRLDSEEQVSLLVGSLYVDSGRIAGSRRLRVLSPAGTIEHVGTQYLVTIRGDTTLIAVREGTLRLDPPAGGLPGAATLIPRGRAIEITTGRGPIWASITPYDTRWNWAAQVAPVFEIEGRSVTAFLDWICRERGWNWSPGSAPLRAELDGILLHGSISGLAADQALALVAAIAEIEIELDAMTGTIAVNPAAAQP